MPLNARQSALSIGLLLGCVSATALAQLPPPPPPPATLWSFLGVPQGYRYIRDNAFNRSGNRPGLERKPPLKAIADPKNLQSPDPAIKKAAEVKQAEDLKLQKIKAVKYLAKIGCGCYNRDGSITDALIKSMDDCTEEVRLATVQAISEAAAGERCANCKMKSCCSEEISNKLYEIAYERDENGCFLEPSERVRLAAAEALRTCCEGNGDMIMMEPGAAPIVPENRGEQPTLAPEVGGERPGIAPPMPINPIPPAIPLQNPVPGAAPLAPPPGGPPAPAPAANGNPQSSRRTVTLKAQPTHYQNSEESVVVRYPLPPSEAPTYDALPDAQPQPPIRVVPHWTPLAGQPAIIIGERAQGPFRIEDTGVSASPDNVSIASLPDRTSPIVSDLDKMDETLGLAPVVSPQTLTPQSAAQLIPSSLPQAEAAPIVQPASVQKPRVSVFSGLEDLVRPVLTKDVSYDTPKPARPRPAAPRQLPGAEFGTGMVTSVRIKEGAAVLEFHSNSELPIGSVLRAYHEYAFGAKKPVCDLKVIESQNGKVVAVPNGRTEVSELAIGDRAVVLH